jgi:hypothetical protein
MYSWALWLLEWAGFVGGGLWAMLDVMCKGVAAALVYRWWRESEAEGG